MHNKVINQGYRAILIRGNAMVVAMGAVCGLGLLLGGCQGGGSAPVKTAIPYQIEQAQGVENIVPVVVIGSGPAGLAAGMYAQRSGHDTWIVEGNKPGGLLTETTLVENWPGIVAMQGPEIMKNSREQADRSGTKFLQDKVTRVDLGQWPFVVETEEGLQIRPLTIIIATGASPRKKGVPGEDTYWGSGVTSCAVCDAPFFKGEDVVVIGGGDSAVEEAIQLSPHVKKVTVLVRRDAMRASASMQQRLDGYKNVAVRFNADVTSVEGDGTKVTGVGLANPQTGDKEIFPTAGVFLAIGHDPSTGLFKGQLAMDETDHILVHGRSQATSVPGVFAAGDVEDRVYRQAGVAWGDGTRAGLDAARFLSDLGMDGTMSEKLAPSMFTGVMRRKEADIRAVTSLDEFKKLLASTDKPIIIDFWAGYCGPCKQFAPRFALVAQEFVDQVIFVKIDIEEAHDVASEYFIQRIPFVMAFREGKVLERYGVSGATSHAEFALFVQNMLNKSADGP